jgi:hypothetical protein
LGLAFAKGKVGKAKNNNPLPVWLMHAVNPGVNKKWIHSRLSLDCPI